MHDYRYYHLSKKEKRNYYVAAGFILAALGLIFYDSLIASLLLLAFVFPGKRYYEKTLAEKHRLALNQQFKDLLYSMSASFQGGRQMTESMEEGLAHIELIYPDNCFLAKELRDILVRLKESREKEETVLYDFAKRSASEDIYSFVDVYFICRTTGGDIVRAIMKAADILTEKMDIEREILTMTAQKRFEAKILLLMPILLVFILKLASPDYIAYLYETMTGVLIMTFALIVTAASYLWSMSLIKINV